MHNNYKIKINQKFNVNIINDYRIMERGFADFEGMTIDKIKKLKEEMPEIIDLWNYNTNYTIMY